MSWRGWRWVLLAATLVAIAMRVYRGAAICMDGDEIFSVGVAEHDWKGLMQAVGQDSIHPPLFYFLLKFWIAIGGDSLFWTRLLPTLFSTLAIVPMVLLGRALRQRPAIVTCAVGLTAIHPYLLYYSQHVRMYTLLMLCALTSLWAFHACLEPGKRSLTARFAVLTAVNAIAVNAHYYGWLVLGLEFCWLIFWKRELWKPMLVSSAIVLAAFLPWAWWVVGFIRAKGGLASNLDWIQKPDAAELAWFFADLSGFGEFPPIGRQGVAGLALFVIVALVIYRHKRPDFVYAARFLGYFVFGSVAVAFTASRLLPSSVWGHRHMLYIVFPMMLLVTAAYFTFDLLAVRIAGGVLFAVWAGLVIQHHLKGDDKKTPFDGLVMGILAQEADNPNQVTVFSVDKYLHYPIWFYLETLKEGKITGFAAPIRSEDRPRLAVEAARIHVTSQVSIDEAKGAHFWVDYGSAWKQKMSPEQILRQRGCRVGEDVTVRDRYHWSRVFPVWCGE